MNTCPTRETLERLIRPYGSLFALLFLHPQIVLGRGLEAGTWRYAVQLHDYEWSFLLRSDGERLRVDWGTPSHTVQTWISGVSEGTVSVLIPTRLAFYELPAIASPVQEGVALKPNAPPPGAPAGGPPRRDRRAQIVDAKRLDDETSEAGETVVHYSLEGRENPDTEVWMIPSTQMVPPEVWLNLSALREAAPALAQLLAQYHALPLRCEQRNRRGKTVFSLELVERSTDSSSTEIFEIPETYDRIAPPQGRRGGPGGPPPGGGGGHPPPR